MKGTLSLEYMNQIVCIKKFDDYTELRRWRAKLTKWYALHQTKNNPVYFRIQIDAYAQGKMNLIEQYEIKKMFHQGKTVKQINQVFPRFCNGTIYKFFERKGLQIPYK